jgi:hypothetical protein
MKVNPPLEEAAAVVGAGADTAAAASEGADIVGAGGEVAWRDLGWVAPAWGCDCDGDGNGQDARWGCGFCALGAACVRARKREKLCGLCLRLVLGSDRLFGLTGLAWRFCGR